MSAPIELILAAFDGEQAAETALKRLKELQKDGVINVVNAAVLVKHADGRASIKETEDVRAPAGAVFGAIVGGLVGLLGGPAGAIVGAAAGAATGGMAAHAIDMGFSDKNLKEIEALLPKGSSAIIALVTLEWVDRVVEALQELDARLWRQALNEKVTGPLTATRVIEGKATTEPSAPADATPVAPTAGADPTPAAAAAPPATAPEPTAPAAPSSAASTAPSPAPAPAAPASGSDTK